MRIICLHMCKGVETYIHIMNYENQCRFIYYLIYIVVVMNVMCNTQVNLKNVNFIAIIYQKMVHVERLRHAFLVEMRHKLLNAF